MLVAKDETEAGPGESKKRNVAGNKSDEPPKKKARKVASSKENSEAFISTKDNTAYRDDSTAQSSESPQDDSLIFKGIKRIFSNEPPLTC